MLHPHDVLRDRYQLQRKLGQTAGRQTWLALDQASQPPTPVIIKFLAFVDQVNWDTLKLFEREASILKQLNHPAIPNYRDYFSIDDRVLWFGLVQEYIPGQSLSELIQQGKRFSLRQVQQMATELLQILVYLHSLTPPVFHRDIKPSNLILDECDRIFLIDFGAVQDRAAIEGSTFTVVGTYGYAPMEQFGGRTVAASDLYSLGATLIHLLTGVSPADLPQRNLQIQFEDQINLPSSIVRWLQVLTHPDVTQRFASAQAALDALEQTWTVANTRSQKHRLLTDQSTARLLNLRLEQRSDPTIPFEKYPSASIFQPASDRVRIYEAPESLTIAIASENLSVSPWLAAGGVSLFGLGVVISVAIQFLLFPILIMGFVVLCWAWELGATTCVVFQQGTFTISRNSPRWVSRLLSRSYTQQISERRSSTDLISSIRAVIEHNMEFAEGKSRVTHRVVTIQTQTEDFSFGKGLERAECIWIVQTIHRWLGSR